MKKLLSHSRVLNLTLGIFLAALLTLGISERGYAQALTRPILPYLSLTGADDFNQFLYPDARLWVPPSTSKTREFLLPIWIRNDWYQIDDTYIPLPIQSFSFSLMYDSSAVRVVGFELDHPNYMEQLGLVTPEEPPTAKGFNVSWDDQRDNLYWYQIQQQTWESNPNQAGRGRRATFVASSPKPLPHNSSFEPRAWKVLMYVRFKVIGRETAGDPNKTWQQTPIYLDNRSIRYNDFDITKDEPKKAMKKWDPVRYPIDYPSVDQNKGILGVRNDDLIGEELNPNFQVEPYRPGTIYLHLTDQEPNFYFPSDPSLGYTISNPKEGYFELDLPITVDVNGGLATQIVKLENNVTSTRLNQVEIESDQPWLKFRTVKIATSDENPIPAASRYGYINYIDNDILGSRNNPRGAPTMAQGKINLEIIGDPTALNLNDPNDPEKSGIYTGYLTFKSPYAKTNPVRMKVTFIYLRNPFEPAGDQNPIDHPGGIVLNLRNSRGAVGDDVQLVFGTGDRATDDVDEIYGERAATSDMSPTEFGARFYFEPQLYKDLAAKYPYGLSDLTPNRTTPRSVSRDIRSYVDKKSHIFYVRFNAGAAQYYPVTLQWDVSQFPEGARVYLRDTQNGTLFPAVDMRNATSGGGSTFYYTFTDARINDFIIEYTLPKTIDTANGMPTISRGWNLLSLPLRPLNAYWKTVFPNAINIPYFFSQNQYQSEEILRPGIGYFIKYGDAIDSQFAGTEMYEISIENPPYDAIRVYQGDRSDPDQPEFYGGWNCIGALSVPINVADIAFTRFQNSPVPDKSYTTKYGVWSYKTGRGYEEVSVLTPGLGYWIKVNSDGYLKLVAPFIPKKESVFNASKNDILAASTKLALRDKASNSYELYLNSNSGVVSMFELPPAPPADLFDARFDGNTYLSASSEALIRLQSVTYPVTVNVTNATRELTFVDAGTGRIFGTVKRGENKEIVIDNAPFDAVRVLTSGSLEMALTVGNNPVATATNVTYTVSEEANVTVELFDATGAKVSTLADGRMAPGAYNVSLDATTLANGAYIVKFTQNNATVIAKISVVK